MEISGEVKLVIDGETKGVFTLSEPQVVEGRTFVYSLDLEHTDEYLTLIFVDDKLTQITYETY